MDPPSRDSLPPLTRYVKLRRNGTEIPTGYVEASRGCLHHCLHCPIPPVYNGRFFVVPSDVVLGDIRRLIAAGARHITFGDPDFLNGPGHARKLVRALHAEFPGVTYDFTAKIEHLLRHRALLPEFARTGCAFLVSAVESLSDVVLANLEKGHTRADALAAFDITRDSGVALRPSFMPFTPWETLDSYLELLDFVGSPDLVDQVPPRPAKIPWRRSRGFTRSRRGAPAERTRAASISRHRNGRSPPALPSPGSAERSPPRASWAQ